MRFTLSPEDSSELRELLANKEPDRERSRRRRKFAYAFNLLLLAALACIAALLHHLILVGFAPGAG